MKGLIAVVGLVLCLVVCSHQMRLVEEDGTRLVKINYTNYALTGPELFKHGLRCASVNGNAVTFWKKDKCEFGTKRMDELSASESELLKIKGKIPKGGMLEHRRIGHGSVITETRSLNHHIDIGTGSTVTLTDSSDNHITVGDGATLTVTGSSNNLIKVDNGRSATITNKHHKEVLNEEIKPLDKSIFGIRMDNSRIYSVPDSDSVKMIVELGDFVAFIMKDDQIQMKPTECLHHEEKALLKHL